MLIVMMNDIVNFHVISHTPINEMQLNMLVWLFLFFTLFSCKKLSELLSERTIYKVSLNMETE